MFSRDSVEGGGKRGVEEVEEVGDQFNGEEECDELKEEQKEGEKMVGDSSWLAELEAGKEGNVGYAEEVDEEEEEVLEFEGKEIGIKSECDLIDDERRCFNVEKGKICSLNSTCLEK